MATTAPAKKVAAKQAPITRRTIADAATTAIPDSGEIVENTEGDKIQLTSSTAPDSEAVTVVVPKAFMLTRDDGTPVQYQAGTQEMPLDDAAHWFSRAHGVKVYSPAA